MYSVITFFNGLFFIVVAVVMFLLAVHVFAMICFCKDLVFQRFVFAKICFFKDLFLQRFVFAKICYCIDLLLR